LSAFLITARFNCDAAAAFRLSSHNENSAESAVKLFNADSAETNL
jgi:hypothetical protein